VTALRHSLSQHRFPGHATVFQLASGRVEFLVSYVRGPEELRDAAIESVRKRQFPAPRFGPQGIQPVSFCLYSAFYGHRVRFSNQTTCRLTLN
jgi:hypothetical protein